MSGVRPARLALSAAALLAASASARAAVTVRQDITLAGGWSAIYLEVAPSGTPDETFADWPVNAVGFYDPAAFLATRQFSKDWDSHGLSMNPVATWRRDYPESNTISSIPAGTVCILFSTNDAPTQVSVEGVPAAPRITWHVTDTNHVYNFVGISLQDGATVSPMDYLEGFKGSFVNEGLYKICGRYEDQTQSYNPVYPDSVLRDGDVMLVASDLQCDWSGVLYVSPMGGLDFGSDSSKATLSVRNDGAEARTVAIDLLTYAEFGDVELPLSAVHLRDADVALTNAAWRTASREGGAVARRRLAAGETWNLQIGIDRAAFESGPRGRTFGALARVTDEDGASRMRVDVPLAGETSGGAASGKAWPGGLWVADVVFTQIIDSDSPTATDTGGSARVRLPVHIDENGKARLLQHVVAAGETDDAGTYEYRLYAGSAAIPSTARQAMRISAVCLPTETPVVEAASNGTLMSEGGLDFEFTVAGDGATSLLRHPLHPQHDGLRWDFKTPAPSGDDFANYKGDVKPETFSVGNRIEMRLDLNGGEAAWNPENEKGGTVRWTLTNLMRKGPVTLLGTMSVRRVSPNTEIVLE